MRLAYRVAEVAEMTGIPRRTIYDLVRDRKLKATRIGKLVLIPKSEVERITQALAEIPIPSVALAFFKAE
jgi:excisionase family DNA binding protein